MKSLALISTLLFSLTPFFAQAATVDGSISTSEYQWDTEGAEGSSKWTTFDRSNDFQEYNDASGGDRWDINYLGTSIVGGQFQFGLIGGEILDGGQTGSGRGNPIFLSDIAIAVTDFGVAATNPTTDSSGFQYAIRLDSIVGDIANFSLLQGDEWEGANIYDNDYAPKHVTETYKMKGNDVLATFQGSWSNNGGDNNVLEGGFDLSLLSIFDPSEGEGGRLSTYITMACVNDEAYVTADVAAVPVPAALWLLTPALVGFMGLRRRNIKQA
ncbi:hypothetical protein A9Q78_04460 [Methylophaga sp. 41_12_T18]|nr:hypothetical protein A9Q78_04460 [Methylophaga sp. 41_12_T18]